MPGGNVVAISQIAAAFAPLAGAPETLADWVRR